MKRVPVLESFSFQPPIIDKDLTAPPGGEAEGDRYIVGGSATGDWAGHDDDIAEYDGASWMFMTPEEGWFVHINDEDKFYKFTGSVWEEFSGGSGGDMYKSFYPFRPFCRVQKVLYPKDISFIECLPLLPIG